MGSRKRKPLSDISNIHNLTPISVLRKLVDSNGIRKPPVSILKSSPNSTNHSLCPESSDRSNATSIGSSSVGATFNSKTVHFRQPPSTLSPTTSLAYNQTHDGEKSNKEKDAYVAVSRTSIEKDKGKAITVPDTQKNICTMPTVGGTGIQKAAYDQIQTIEKSRKERMFDGIVSHAAVMERKDKGKAIAIPYNSLPTGKLKETWNNVCSSSSLAERSSQKGLGNLSFSNGSTENVKESNQGKLVSYSHSSGKAERGEANLSSCDRALGKKSEKGKDIADTSGFSLEKVNDTKEGISKRTRSSTVQIKETREECLSPSTSLVGAKDRSKSVNITNSLPDKAKGKGKVILEPSNIRGSSAAVAVKSQPLRKTSEKNKNVIGTTSCPPMTRTKKIMNDPDKAGDGKYSKSWTDLQAKARKKRNWKTEEISELPAEFIREQKAYYDEIDNFELEVEEVSEGELE